jgi:hypothetical protein
MRLFAPVVNPVVKIETRRWTYMVNNFMPKRHCLHLQLPPLFSLHPLIVELFDFLLEIFSSLESWLREALYFLSSSCSFLFSPYNFLFSSGNFLNSRRCCSSWNLSRRCSTLGCTIFSFLEGSLLFGSAHFSSWQYFTRSSSVASLCRVLSLSVEDLALPWLDRSAKFCAFALVAS